MGSKFLGISLAVILAMPLFAVSCGDGDDNGTAGPGNGDVTSPPGIANIELPQGIDFQSNDPVAQQAQMATGIALIPLVLTIGNPLVTALQNATWGEPAGGCWTWTFTPEEGCSFLYSACKTNSGFDWTVPVAGDCYDEIYGNWIAIRGTSNYEGTTGTLRWFDDHTTVLAEVWTWTTTAEWMSGTLNIYEGDLAPENLGDILEWTRHTDGSVDATHTAIDKGKLELHISADGTAGWVKTYDLEESTQTYVIEKWISWENGTGFWNVYDEGALVEERTW